MQLYDTNYIIYIRYNYDIYKYLHITILYNYIIHILYIYKLYMGIYIYY